MTAEPVSTDLSYREASELTAQIKDKVVTIQANIDRLAALVRRAKDGNAHVVLGFASWTAYIADTVGSDPLDLTRAERKKLVTFLASEGMSARAIAPVVGVSKSQVAEDVSEATVQFPDSRPEKVTGLDGRDRPATQPKSASAVKVTETTKTESFVNTETGEVTDKPAEWVSPTVVLSNAEPRQDRRRPLTDGFRDASLDLGKLIVRINNLVEDDRFPRNKNEVARYANDLIRARDALQRAIDQMS